jgi:hypothetical protein
VPCLWGDNHRSDVFSKNKRGVIFPVKQKIKVNLRMVVGDSSQVLVGKPSNALQFVFYQQPGVNRNFQDARFEMNIY